MKRRLLDLLTLLSLAACLAVAVLWARSGTAFDELRYASLARGRSAWFACGACSAAGRVFFGTETRRAPAGAVDPGPGGMGLQFRTATGNDRLRSWGTPYLMLMGRHGRDRLGFATLRMDDIPAGGELHSARGLMVPHWVLFGLFATPPALWALRERSRRRATRRGLCPSCGYDLRATPGRCPECGMTTP